MRRALLTLVLLAACDPAVLVTSSETFRDPGVTIASKADFDPAAFAGDWHEVARFPGTPGCPGARLSFAAEGQTLRRTTRCPDGTATATNLAVGRLGRLTVGSGPAERPIWVLWADTGYRTAVLVSPDGTGGRILDRAPAVPVDRLRAALDVLDFNGFDTSALQFE